MQGLRSIADSERAVGSEKLLQAMGAVAPETDAMLGMPGGARMVMGCCKNLKAEACTIPDAQPLLLLQPMLPADLPILAGAAGLSMHQQRR